MYIEEIKIENFRIFKELNITLNKGMNFFIGENNSGKTALLDAIRYTLNTNSSEFIKIKENDFHNDTSNFYIRLKFSELTDIEGGKFIEHLTYDNENINLYISLKCELTKEERYGSAYIKREICSGIDGNGNLIEQELRDFLSVTYLQALRDADAQLNYGRGSRLSQILLNTSNISEKGEMEGIIDILSKASKAILEKNSIKTTKDVITEKYLKNLILSDEKLNAEISMIGTTSSEEMNDNLQRRVLKNILEKLSLNFDSNLKQGLGYNNLLFIAAELLLLSSSINSGQKTLLIEEPEAHLHPQLQLRLLEFLNSKSKENVQMFISSHSPNIASKVPLKNIFILNKGNVLSLRKDETGLAEEDYIFLEKFLDVTKSNLFFAKGVILVEGTSEEILLPSIARAIDYPLENYGISIVNIGNTAFKRYAKIFHRTTENESIGIKVACVRDLDLKPIKADEEKFPNIGFIKRKNEDTWLKETKQEIENQIETKMGKLKKDLENQDVKVFVSDVWTFEYSLIHNGMNNSIFSLYKNSLKVDTYDDLAEDDEEKAIKLFSKIHKTDSAYQLANIIDATPSDYSEKTFPKYICDAIKYVIGVSDDKR